jgi:hypothetical protein
MFIGFSVLAGSYRPPKENPTNFYLKARECIVHKNQQDDGHGNGYYDKLAVGFFVFNLDTLLLS